MCAAQGACTSGAMRTVACGNCGVETDVCGSSCQWTAGTCTDQGACTPGSTRSSPCGSCGGARTDTCSTSCQWTAGACNDMCVPDAAVAPDAAPAPDAQATDL